MEADSATLIRTWLDTLPRETRARLFLLLAELCAGMDVSRHNQFGFLRLRAEFETSRELFGCTLAELRDAIGTGLGDVSARRPKRPPARSRSSGPRSDHTAIPTSARWKVAGIRSVRDY